MRHLPITFLGAALLSGCGPTYSDTLEQKLAGKTPDQQQAILAKECGQEIAADMQPNSKANVDHSKRMQEICEEMAGQPVPVAAPASKK